MEDPTEGPVPWPQLGDTAFGSGEDWWMNSSLHIRPKDWDVYAWGYKDAADMIVEKAAQRRGSIDMLVYPVAFLYRHYLELRLKILIKTGEALFDLKLPPNWLHNHRIDVLWEHCRKILEQVWPEGPSEDLDAVGACIKEFASFDPHSMAFRYPVDKDGNAFLQSLKHVNLRQLGEVVGRAAALLDASSDVMGQELDMKYEMMHDAGSY